jgi:hypothetical protein
VEWEQYPPSAADLREYNEEVYPQKVLQATKKLLEKYGPGYWLEIMPGVRAWIATKQSRN